MLHGARHKPQKRVLQVLFRFADGEEEPVPGAYIEFAERRPLPQFAHLPVCGAWVARVLPGCATSCCMRAPRRTCLPLFPRDKSDESDADMSKDLPA